MPRGWWTRAWWAVLGAALALPLAGCPRHGIVDDGTSISWGPSNDGWLVNPVRLPRHGDGYHIPQRWATRGLNWGTDEMVDLVVHLGRVMKSEYPRSSMGVADISQRRGGPSQWHRSHQTGRDTDILFFATDKARRPIVHDRMDHFQRNGATKPGLDENGNPTPSVYFDVKRNWRLVRAVIENPVARVQYMFVYDPLKQKMLDYARELGEPPAIIEFASYILHQPSDSLNHNDHFHLRIYCSPSDRVHGCRDRGTLRWTKRDRKYVHVPRRRMVAMDSRTRHIAAGMPAMLSLSSLPFRGFVPK